MPKDGDCALYSIKACLPFITDSVNEMRNLIANKLIEELHEGTHALEIEVMINMEEGNMDAATALSTALADLEEHYHAYRRRGRDGGPWIDPSALQAITKLYNCDITILSPDGSWTVVREHDDEAAPNVARIALPQTAARRVPALAEAAERRQDNGPVSDAERRRRRRQAENLDNGGGHYRPLHRLKVGDPEPTITVPPRVDAEGALAQLTVQVERRRARVEALANGRRAISEVDAVDRLILKRLFGLLPFDDAAEALSNQVADLGTRLSALAAGFIPARPVSNGPPLAAGRSDAAAATPATIPAACLASTTSASSATANSADPATSTSPVTTSSVGDATTVPHSPAAPVSNATAPTLPTADRHREVVRAVHPAQILSQLHLAAYIYGYQIRDVPGDGDCAIHSVLACMPHLTDGGLRVAGLSEEDAVAAAESELRKDFETYRPNGGAWVDHAALVALTRVYEVDIAVLHPDASWSVVEATPGRAAPHCARLALHQPAPIPVVEGGSSRGRRSTRTRRTGTDTSCPSSRSGTTATRPSFGPVPTPTPLRPLWPCRACWSAAAPVSRQSRREPA